VSLLLRELDRFSVEIVVVSYVVVGVERSSCLMRAAGGAGVSGAGVGVEYSRMEEVRGVEFAMRSGRPGRWERMTAAKRLWEGRMLVAAAIGVVEGSCLISAAVGV
jgi:hypothetical protein